MHSTAVAVAALVLSLQVCGLLAQPGQDKKTLEGVLTYIDYHDGTGDWALLDRSNGHKFQPLGKGKKPPKKDKNGKDLEPGQYMTLGCTVDTTTGQCSFIDSADVTVLKPAFVPPATNVRQNLLVVIMDAPTCGAAASSSATVSNLRTLYFGSAGDGKGGWAARLENCSYGEVVWEPPTSGLTQFVTVTPACTWPTTSCDAYAMSNAANAAARAKLGDLVFSDFTHFHLVMNIPSSCSWAGLATLGGGVDGGGQVWLNTNTWTQTFGSFQVPLQEAIHNFVLYHGFSSGIEYQDKTTFMGTGQACPSVTEKRWLGWASPIAGGDGLDAAALTPGAALGPFNVPASWTTGLGNHVRVKPTWTSWYNNANYGMNLYFEFRQAMLADANMAVTYNNKVVVHEILSYMDNDQATYRSQDPRSNYMINVAPNTRTVLTSPSLGVAYNLVLYVGAQFGASNEFVPMYICRFITSDTECGTLTNVLANAPKSPPPPLRPPTPPPNPSPPSPAPSPPPPPAKPPSPSPPSPRPPSPRPPSPSPPKPPSPKPPSPRPPNPSPPPKNQKSPSAKPGERAPPMPPLRSRPPRRLRSPPPSRRPRTRSGEATDAPAVPADGARR